MLQRRVERTLQETKTTHLTFSLLNSNAQALTFDTIFDEILD